MKKVAYHVHHSGTLIERSLAQLATYFRTDHEDEVKGQIPSQQVLDTKKSSPTNSTSLEPGSYFIHSDRFTTIVDARMQCKGACHDSADARAIAKQICCLPRHPLKKRPTIMANLPRSLETAGLVREALLTITTDEISVEQLVILDDASSADIHCNTWQQRVEAALDRLGEHNDISTDMMAFIRLLVICRGADKAVRMVDEVFTAKAAISFVCDQIKVLLPVLAQREAILNQNIVDLRREVDMMSPTVDPDRHTHLTNSIATNIRKRIHYHRHWNLLSGALPHLTELMAWLRNISDIVAPGGERHQQVMFLASDSSDDRHTLPAALQVPKVEVDTMALFTAYRAVETLYRPQMFHTIRTRGWPSSLQHALASSNTKEDKVADNKHCHICERSYSCLWVHRGVCCECEDRIRQVEKRCPFRAVCKSTWFCPHSLRCLICDAHSCDECCLMRGDSGMVTAVATRLSPRRIAFDFDRTLASTKSGAMPVIGKHVADVDLVSLMWKYSCVVVTRNQNKTAIALFLADQGAPPDVEICIVGKKESKVKFILGLKDSSSASSKQEVTMEEKEEEEYKEWTADNTEGRRNKTTQKVAEAAVTTETETREGGCHDLVHNSSSAGLGPSPVLFVDDSVQELVDPLVAQEASIYRILFVRSLA